MPSVCPHFHEISSALLPQGHLDHGTGVPFRPGRGRWQTLSRMVLPTTGTAWSNEAGPRGERLDVGVGGERRYFRLCPSIGVSMTKRLDQTSELQALIEALAGGNELARDHLIERSTERLRRLTRKMLRDNPAVHRHEGTDDVLQNACIRLLRALKDVKPDSVKAYLGLAALQIRRELIDLYRHYYGEQGAGRYHHTDADEKDPRKRQQSLAEAAEDRSPGPVTTLRTAELHLMIDKLAEEEREICDLLFYQGLTQEQAAALLQVSIPTVKRRWRAARLALQEKFKE